MDIGTAKVTAAERRSCRTTAWIWSNPDEPFTAADFRRYALGALAGIAPRGASRCWWVAPACTCAPLPAACLWTRPALIRQSRATLELRLERRPARPRRRS